MLPRLSDGNQKTGEKGLNQLSNINDELLFDFQIAEYKIKLLKILPNINKARSILGLKEPVASLLGLGIPLKQILESEKYKGVIEQFFSTHDISEKSGVQGGPVKTVEALLNLDNDAFKRIINRGLDQNENIVRDSVRNISYLLNEEIDIVVEALVEKVTGIIEYYTVHEKSMYDALTMLMNKESINEYGKEQFEIAKKNPLKNPLTIMVIDIDRFKLINDLYGHDAGDMVLQEIAKKLQLISKDARIGKGEVKPGRDGGEEFMIIAPDTDSKKAREIAEMIARELGKISLREKSTHMKGEITCSTGGAILNKKSKYLKFGLQKKKADYNSYKAKRKGRNGIVFDDDEEEIELNKKEDEVSGLVLNMDKIEIDYDKILVGFANKIPNFIATLVIQQQKIKNGEHISSLSPIDFTYGQVAYLMSYIFQEKGYGWFEWLKVPLAHFIRDNGNTVGLDGRFPDAELIIEKGDMSRLISLIKENSIGNNCVYLKDFLNDIN